MKRLYEKYIRHKMFNKMLLIYTVITITSIFLLCYVFINYYIENELQNELRIQSEVIFNIEKRFEEQNSLANSVVNGINAQSKIVEEVTILVNSNYEEYFNYKLDNFQISGTNYVDLKYVIDTILSNRKDALAVVINDKNQEFKRKFVVNRNISYKVEDMDKNNNIRKITKPIKNIDTMYTVGYIDVYFDLKQLNNIIKGSSIKGDLVVLNQNNQIVFNSSKKMDYDTIYTMIDEKNYRDASDENILLNILDNNPIVEIKQDSKNGFKFVSIINNKNLDTNKMIIKIVCLSTACIVSIVLITYTAINTYSSKLKKMMHGIGKIKNGDLNDKIEIEEQEDELDMIALSINDMSESLEFYIKNHYVAHVRQKEAEMSALQSQIKPHFLFNTLEVIRMYALTSNNKDVAQMIFNLANMFRYSTYDNGGMVTLNEEIKHCKMYLELCCSRYKGLIKYNINVSDHMLDYRVPKFLLQPILENSINHGLDKSSSDNVISIDIFELGENLEITIVDNGCGMSEEKLNETRYGLEKNLHKSDSIGLMNTNNRLKLKFGYEYGIELDSEVNKGTIVKIKLPVKRGDD